MAINLSVPANHDLKPRITVIGVGGAGGNAVNNMITGHLEGVDFVVANTDSQALSQSLTDSRIQLGVNITHGLGAGARPDIGKAAAEEALDEIVDHLQGSNMVFIAAGMGGGTGTGAGPVIARAAREQGILGVGVVTKPFHFEGVARMQIAETGLEELQQFVDTLIVIPNQNLFRIANEKTTFADAFKMADNVLHLGVRGVTDLMVMPGLINLDFADVRTVMSEMGKAMMGTGESEGERRAIEAAEAAINNPLLDDVSMKGARGVLINITGGNDITLFEVDEAVNRIREEVDPEANIIFGSTFDESLADKMRVSVVATGIDVAAELQRERLFERRPRLVAVGAGAESLPEESAPSETRAAAPVAPKPTPRGNRSTAGSEGKKEKPRQAWDALLAQAAVHSEPGESISAHGADGPFIPPRPVETSDEDHEAKGPTSLAPATTNPTRPSDPESALAKPAARSPSLFERMTRTGRGRDVKEQKDKAWPSLKPTSAHSGPRKPSPAAGPGLSTPDEDFLEIPAFLRRQAN